MESNIWADVEDAVIRSSIQRAPTAPIAPNAAADNGDAFGFVAFDDDCTGYTYVIREISQLKQLLDCRHLCRELLLRHARVG